MSNTLKRRTITFDSSYCFERSVKISRSSLVSIAATTASLGTDVNGFPREVAIMGEGVGRALI